ncbi:MAG: DUF2784 domain-containing protein [Nitrospirae bacterium]|nr:MAG: DUF2784 domain-containing protein [Nitrospirota bacterium]
MDHSPKLYQIFADLVVILHLAFVVFVLFGGLLVLWWRRVAWIHLPAVAWGAAIEFGGWICPLTPLETWLRMQGGEGGYNSDFIEHYILPLLYPAGLTREEQIALGAVVLAVNLAIYGWVWRRVLVTTSQSRS